MFDDDYPNPDRHERGTRPSEEIAAALRQREQSIEAFALAKAIGVSKDSVARCCARMPLYQDTLTKIIRYLRAGGHLR